MPAGGASRGAQSQREAGAGVPPRGLGAPLPLRAPGQRVQPARTGCVCVCAEVAGGPEEPGVRGHETCVGGMERPLQSGAPGEGFAAQGLGGSRERGAGQMPEADHLLSSAPLPGGLPRETLLWTLPHPELGLPHEMALPEGCRQRAGAGIVVLKVWPRNPCRYPSPLRWLARTSYFYNQTRVLSAFSCVLSPQTKIRSRGKNPVVFYCVRPGVANTG